jgi:NCS1 family nucleobase:cation symporter-1
MVLNGTIGARLHVSFPVINRSSFGFWFSYFSVISRVILSMFWFGVQVIISYIGPRFDVLTHPLQTYTGGECVYQVTKLIVF